MCTPNTYYENECYYSKSSFDRLDQSKLLKEKQLCIQQEVINPILDDDETMIAKFTNWVDRINCILLYECRIPIYEDKELIKDIKNTINKIVNNNKNILNNKFYKGMMKNLDLSI